MGENVLGFPALQIELGPRWQKIETGLRQWNTALAREHRIQSFARRLQVWRVGVILRDLHHVGAAVAVRQLHHAKPVAMRIKAHGLGIDRHRSGVVGQIGQVAAMQAYGHGVQNLVESMRYPSYRSTPREASGGSKWGVGRISCAQESIAASCPGNPGFARILAARRAAVYRFPVPETSLGAQPHNDETAT